MGIGMIDFRLEIEQNLQPIPERMRLVRLWNISLGKVEGAETVRFYRQGHL